MTDFLDFLKFLAESMCFAVLAIVGLFASLYVLLVLAGGLCAALG